MTKPTNMIVFLTDNHNREFMGVSGHPTVKTPVLDKLAAEGTRFTNAYCASPLCCPSRAAIATGRYPHQTGYWDNALAYDGNVPTWHHRVRDAGYKTAAIGKLHFRSEEDDNGFSEEIDVMHIVEAKGALITLLRASQDGIPRRESHKAIYADSTVGEADYQIYDRRISSNAIEWLQQHADQEQPWVLLVSFPSPHPPFKVPQRFWDMYPLEEVPMPVQWMPSERPEHPAVEYLAWMNHLQDGFSEEYIRRVIAGYCGLISHTDEQVGLVLDEVNKLGLNENTQIIYTSDHGEAAGHHGILGKANHYEHGIGVPFIMSGVGIEKGKVIDDCISHVDLFPTVLESMGITPSEADKDLPGKSLWTLIRGEETESYAFAEYHAMGSRNSGFTYREGQFKLIYHVEMPRQLFNLKADPKEERDLLLKEGFKEVADKLEAKLRMILDPEAIDDQSKRDQARHLEKFGGIEEVRKGGVFSRSPIPGVEVEIEKIASK